MRLRTYRRNAPLWMAAARGACRSGDHVTERRYRDTARMLLRRPPLLPAARCIERST